MQIKPLRNDLESYLAKHGLVKKFAKQIKIFSANPRYPSLHTEILELKSSKVYSFRIDKKYRAIFILTQPDETEIVDINNHYH